MPVSRYVTLRTVKHSGSEFPAGTPMALSDEYAAPLLAIGAIQAQAGALPAMPTVPGDVVRETVDTGSGGKARTYVEAISSGSGVAFQVGDAAARMGVEMFSLPYPMILVSSGTFNDTAGNFTLGTALPAVPNGTVPGGGNAMIYLPATAGGLAGGWYAATFSSTTAGQLVGAPVTTATAWTQTTAAVVGPRIAIAAGGPGPNGSIEIETATSNNGTGGGTKSIRWGIDAATNQHYIFQNGTAFSTRGRVKIRNRGALNRNVITNAAGQYAGTGAVCQTTSIDFSAVRTLEISLQVSLATDFNILEMVDVAVTYGA